MPPVNGQLISLLKLTVHLDALFSVSSVLGQLTNLQELEIISDDSVRPLPPIFTSTSSTVFCCYICWNIYTVGRKTYGLQKDLTSSLNLSVMIMVLMKKAAFKCHDTNPRNLQMYYFSLRKNGKMSSMQESCCWHYCNDQKYFCNRTLYHWAKRAALDEARYRDRTSDHSNIGDIMLVVTFCAIVQYMTSVQSPPMHHHLSEISAKP